MEELGVVKAVVNVELVRLVVLADVAGEAHLAEAGRIHRRLVRRIAVLKVKAHRIGRVERGLLLRHHLTGGELGRAGRVLDNVHALDFRRDRLVLVVLQVAVHRLRVCRGEVGC